MYDIDECEDIEDYEAYVYKAFNVITEEVYWGFHKGDKNDSYHFSSKNEKFHKSYVTNRKDWKKIIVYKGNKYDMAYKEYKHISYEMKTNGKKCMNKAVGAPRYLRRVSEENKIVEVLGKIQESKTGKGPYEIKYYSKQEMYSMDRYQVRENTDSDLMQDMIDKMNDESGDLTDIKTYMTHGGLINGQLTLLNGNNTVICSSKTDKKFRDNGTIPFMVIEERDLRELGLNGIETLSLSLNGQQDIIRTPESLNEAVSWCLKRIELDENEKVKNRESLMSLLTLYPRNWSSRKASGILKKATNEKLTEIEAVKNDKDSWIKYSNREPELKKMCKETTDKFNASGYASTTRFGRATALDIANAKNKDGEYINHDKKTITIYVHSPNDPVHKEWRKQKAEKFKEAQRALCIMNDDGELINSWTLKIIELPEWQDKGL